MGRLIDEEEAFKVLSAYYKHRYYEQDEALLDALSRVPTVDAEPVRHGKWITYCKTKDSNLLICSECKMLFNVGMGRIDESHYCPNCGARMDRE